MSETRVRGRLSRRIRVVRFCVVASVVGVLVWAAVNRVELLKTWYRYQLSSLGVSTCEFPKVRDELVAFVASYWSTLIESPLSEKSP
ncbi:MAG: hypothetical protein AAF517_15725 [Planctomycetota bacterium]